MSEQPNPSETLYTERLWPTPWLYVVLLLIVPAVMLLLMPLNMTLGLVLAPLLYLLIAGFFTLSSPTITVTNTEFRAGSANIPVRYLGEITPLDSDELAVTIGIKSDARAYMLVRGWIHQGLKITNTDPTDPAPYWVVTTRNPSSLTAALHTAPR